MAGAHRQVWRVPYSVPRLCVHAGCTNTWSCPCPCPHACVPKPRELARDTAYPPVTGMWVHELLGCPRMFCAHQLLCLAPLTKKCCEI